MFPEKRAAGILCHISSLPGKHGIGDLGEGADVFLNYLEAAGQHYWQILPTGPTARFFGNSPYAALSSWAGNPLFINLDLLQEMGLLSGNDLRNQPEFSEYLVDFRQVSTYKLAMLAIAYQAFHPCPPADFAVFIKKTAAWLEPYCLFQALRAVHKGRSWDRWPAVHDHKKCGGPGCPDCREKMAESINFHRFLQYIFHLQWQRLRQKAHAGNIAIIGDMPYYTAFDSADTWSAPHLFQLDKRRQPIAVAGVPPDYFSATGQRWGNPLYRWFDDTGGLNQELVVWWAARLRHTLEQVDLVRIDHFRGFDSFWSVPATEKNAIKGRWQKGPGAVFFKNLTQKNGRTAIIAEDLGIITPAVEKLRKDCGFPGMKVLQFACDNNPENTHLPQNFDDPRTVVYTGTHDNDTTLGWYMDPATDDSAREQLHRLTNTAPGEPVHRTMLRLAFGSTARLAIIPMQDALGFGSDCRMNRPGTTEGNWQWRLAPRFLTPESAAWLRDETRFYNR